MESKNANLIDYLFILTKWRKFVLINFFIVCLVTVTIVLIVPKKYTAKTTILPPVDDSQGFGLAQFIGNLPMGGFGLGGYSEETYTVMAILNSRTTMEAIVKQFNLIKQYNSDNVEEAVKELRTNVRTEINEDGTISLFASAKTNFLASDMNEDSTRQMAAEMARSFIKQLDQYNIALKTEKAKNTRLYIEKRYEENLADLAKGEDAFKDFQKKYDVIALPEQTAAAIEAAAEISARINIKEIEIALMSKYVSGSHTDLARAKNELIELKNKLHEMKAGNGKPGGDESNLFIPFNDVPEVGVEYVRLFREVKLQEKLLEFLLPQYEQAKITESKDTPTIQVLDDAVPPILRSSPKRGLTVVAMGMASIIISLLIILTIEYLNKIRYTDTEKYEKVEHILLEIKSDFNKITHRSNRHVYLQDRQEKND
jgi:tyrosine-protein kinase Etk/Wzc